MPSARFYSPRRHSYTGVGGSCHTRRLNLHIHRVFISWFEQARMRFELSVRIQRITRRQIELVVDAFAGCIIAYVDQGGMNLGVRWQGCFVDYLAWLDARPVRDHDGYRCGLCFPDDTTCFASKAALWQEHCFEPFLGLVNKQLTHNDCLHIHGHVDGAGKLALMYSPSHIELSNSVTPDDGTRSTTCVASVTRNGAITVHRQRQKRQQLSL